MNINNVARAIFVAADIHGFSHGIGQTAGPMQGISRSFDGVLGKDTIPEITEAELQVHSSSKRGRLVSMVDEQPEENDWAD